jgi:hypothetical protein
MSKWVAFPEGHDAAAQTDLVRAARAPAAEFTWARILAGVELGPIEQQLTEAAADSRGILNPLLQPGAEQ